MKMRAENAHLEKALCDCEMAPVLPIQFFISSSFLPIITRTRLNCIEDKQLSGNGTNLDVTDDDGKSLLLEQNTQYLHQAKQLRHNKTQKNTRLYAYLSVIPMANIILKERDILHQVHIQPTAKSMKPSTISSTFTMGELCENGIVVLEKKRKKVEKSLVQR